MGKGGRKMTEMEITYKLVIECYDGYEESVKDRIQEAIKEKVAVLGAIQGFGMRVEMKNK